MDTVTRRKVPLRRRLVPAILRRLDGLGLKFEVYFVVREGFDIDRVAIPGSQYEFRFLTPADSDALRKFEPEESSIARTEAWFEEGRLCFGAMEHDKVVAVMWCDLVNFSYAPSYRRLGPHEVYLFGARVDPEFRGSGIAPELRAAFYGALRELGRTEVLSYTDYFNRPAQRFKQKLGARNETLNLHIGLFGKLQHTFTLRRYS